jgi:hypothetical protein
LKITLTEADLAVIHVLGTLRSTMSRAAHSNPHWRPKHQFTHSDQIAADTLGVAAEYAWAKHHNLFPDLTFHARRNGYDSLLHGWRIDLKATTNPNGRLILNPAQNNPDIDAYVLAIVTLPDVHFIGYALTHELRNQKALNNLGHGPCYVLEQHQLRPFKEDLREGADRSKPAAVAGVHVKE